MEGEALVLIPFDRLPLPEQTLKQAVVATAVSPAEIVLLRVNPPRWGRGCVDTECLYSELKGLQAQLQLSPVPIRLEVASGPIDQAIARYAARYGSKRLITSGLTEVVDPEKIADLGFDLTSDQAELRPPRSEGGFKFGPVPFDKDDQLREAAFAPGINDRPRY